ncbi:Uncharacterised protein [Mycobacteroides abscessus subsp. massiliense]|nr:Uncharacterised protein [Mycobacteroides abscessus subsp. massiliense]
MAANQAHGLLHVLGALPKNLQAILVLTDPLAGVTTALRHVEGLLSPLMALVDFCAIHRD